MQSTTSANGDLENPVCAGNKSEASSRQRQRRSKRVIMKTKKYLSEKTKESKWATQESTQAEPVDIINYSNNI